MPLPVVLALLGAALVTVAALVWAVVVLVRRLSRLGGDLDRLQRDVAPALERLQADAEVTEAEVTALGARLEAFADQRAARPRRRWRPPPAR